MPIIGTDITRELVLVYSLIGLVIALIIIILIVDRFNSKKKKDLFSNSKLTKSLRDLESISKEVKETDKEDTSILETKSEPIEVSSVPVVSTNEIYTDELLESDEEEYEPEPELEKTQAQIDVEEIKKALEKAQAEEERVDPYQKFEEEQEQNAIISYDELAKNFDRLYDESEKIQYIEDDNLPINIEELYQRNEEILNPKKVKLEDLNTVQVKVEKELRKEPANNGFKSSPLISPVYGIQNKPSTNNARSNVSSSNYEVDEEMRKTNEFLKTLKELQKNLD